MDGENSRGATFGANTSFRTMRAAVLVRIGYPTSQTLAVSLEYYGAAGLMHGWLFKA